MGNSKFKHFFFAGGGTGGHIYPNLAVAEAVRALNKDAYITFFCSRREVDARVLAPSGYEFLPLPAVGLSLNPLKFGRFFGQFISSYEFVKQILRPVRQDAVVIGTGGFVTGPVVMAARALKVPVFLINVDSKPGKANRLLGRFAKQVFVQFDASKKYFGNKTMVTGCPLRPEFEKQGTRAKIFDKLESEGLQLKADKKVLLVTGASSGAKNINNAMLELLNELRQFAESWQVVHLTGQMDYERVYQAVQQDADWYKALDYWDDMASLLGAADVVIGRAGAVSIAEYAAAGAATVCLPYPYHQDRHQYHNAKGLSDAGGAIIVEDNMNQPKQTAADLGRVVKELITSSAKREAMRTAAKSLGKADAANQIARIIASIQANH